MTCRLMRAGEGSSVTASAHDYSFEYRCWVLGILGCVTASQRIRRFVADPTGQPKLRTCGDEEEAVDIETAFLKPVE